MQVELAAVGGKDPLSRPHGHTGPWSGESITRQKGRKRRNHFELRRIFILRGQECRAIRDFRYGIFAASVAICKSVFREGGRSDEED
jgi:hypothetical protein